MNTERYQAILTSIPHHAVIRTTWRNQDGRDDSGMQGRSDRIVVAAAVIWTDTHATLTYMAKIGSTQLDVTREMLELVIDICPGGSSMNIMFGNDE
jgi:hypothetical protein